MSLNRRTGIQRRGAIRAVPGNPDLVPDQLIITSTSPPGLVNGGTFQASAELRNSRTGGTIAGTIAWSTNNAAIATVNSSTGLVTGGATPGTATITASGAGLTATTAIVVQASQTPTTMTVTPSSQTIDVSQPLTIAAVLTDGSGVPMGGRTFSPVSGTPSVGTVGAMNTASDPTQTVVLTPLLAGSTTVTITDNASGLNDTCAVTVTGGGGGGVQPWLENDFDYADITALLADIYNASTRPTGAWSTGSGETVGSGQMSLIAEGPPGGSGKSLRYTYLSSAGPKCSDTTIGINVQFPQNKSEVWVEVYARHSANFSVGTNATCGGTPTAGHKFIFGRVNGGDRFEIKLGNNGLYLASKWPNDPGGVVQYNSSIPTTAYFNNTWHRYRMHMKVGAAGIFKCWFNDTLWRNSTNQPITTATYVYGVSLGRNLNLTPLVSPNMTIDWGLYRVYDTDPGW